MNGRVPVRTATTESIEVDGDVLLFDGATLHRLTGSAAAIHASIDGVTGVDRIARDLAAAFTGDPATVARDVEAVLSELAGKGLVALREPVPGPAYRRAAHVAWARDGDHVVIVDLRTGARHALPATGARAWELVLDLGEEAAVVAALQEEHPDAESLPHDVAVLLQALTREELLEPISDAGGS